jgi:hypothetical protein
MWPWRSSRKGRAHPAGRCRSPTRARTSQRRPAGPDPSDRDRFALGTSSYGLRISKAPGPPRRWLRAARGRALLRAGASRSCLRGHLAAGAESAGLEHEARRSRIARRGYGRPSGRNFEDRGGLAAAAAGSLCRRARSACIGERESGWRVSGGSACAADGGENLDPVPPTRAHRELDGRHRWRHPIEPDCAPDAAARDDETVRKGGADDERRDAGAVGMRRRQLGEERSRSRAPFAASAAHDPAAMSCAYEPS